MLSLLTPPVARSWFDRIVLFFILTNCVFLAMDDVYVEPGSDRWQMRRWAEFFFTWFFTLELLVKVDRAHQ